MTRIIALANQKGGVGKSTTAQNLAAGLTQITGKRALLVDLDAQANSTTPNIDVLPRELEISMYDVLRGVSGGPKVGVAECLISGPEYDLLPASPRLVDSEIELVSAMGRESLLRRAMRPILPQYDYILLDCPAGFGILTLNAFEFATEVLIPLQCEFYALDGVELLNHKIALARETLNPDLQLTGVVLTFYNKQLKICRGVEKEARNWFKDKLLSAKIRRNVSVSEAPSYGQSVLAYSPESTGAEDYRALTKEIIAMER